ncbi:MAG: phage baseplate protein [Beduini sp.]|uniref:phage baseplate protein n=1 Tax=Beduini sp. TaxID=1922300 RepID=UPI0039A1FEEC
MSYWLSQAVYSIGQSTTENYTNVRVDLYFDRDSGSAWNNYTTYGYIIVDGQRQDFSVGSYGTASRILLATRDFRVYHNGDGTKTVNYSCYFNADNSPYVGALSSSGSYTCPTIPRAAPITNVSYSNIYSSFYASFTSYSSSFNYKLRVSIPNVVALETYSNYTSGATKTLSVEKQKYLVDYLNKNGKTSASLGFVIETYSGSTKIGESSEVTRTFVKPTTSDITSFSVSNIDSNVKFTLAKKDYWAYYGYSLTIKYGSLVLYSGGYNSSITVSDSSKMSQLYTAMKNVSSGTFTATLTSTYGGYNIGLYTKNATGTLINIAPVFSSSFGVFDGEQRVTNVTGNNQIIVQTLSTIVFIIPQISLKKNAVASSLKLTFNGRNYDVPIGKDTSQYVIGTIATSGTYQATLTATDSRGKTVSSTINVVVTPYSKPSVSWDYYRANADGTKNLLGGTYIYVKPTFSVAKVAGNAVNGTLLKIGGTSVSSSFVSGTGVNYGSAYAINNSYALEIFITDKLGETTKLTGTITAAELPFNITKDKTGVGIGTVAVKNQITLGKKTQAQQEIFSTGSFNKGSWNAPKSGVITQIIDSSGSQHSVIVGKDSSGNRHYGLDFYDNTSSRRMRLYSGSDYLEVGSTTSINGDKILTLNKAFPVNSIYLTYTNINPGTFLGGTWSLIGQNRYIVGAGSSYSGGATGGSSSTGGTALTVAQIPNHDHVLSMATMNKVDGSFGFSNASRGYADRAVAIWDTSSISTRNTGGGAQHYHSFTPNYIALYIWRRTA